MRVTIIPIDRAVYVNGDARKVDDHIVFPDVHAIQWYDSWGEVEYVGHTKPNERIESIEPYMYLIDHHKTVVKREDALAAMQAEKDRLAFEEEERAKNALMESLLKKIEELEKKLAG